MILWNHEYPVIKKNCFRKTNFSLLGSLFNAHVTLPFTFIIMKRFLNELFFAAKASNEEVKIL